MDTFLSQILARPKAQVFLESGEGTLESGTRTETPVSLVGVAFTKANRSLTDERRVAVVQKIQKLCVTLGESQVVAARVNK